MRPTRARILHLRSGCGLYGADRALLSLAEATLPPLTPTVGCIVRPGGVNELAAEARRRGLDVFVLESAGRVDLRSVGRLITYVQREQIQVMHAHDYKSLSIAALAAARTGVALVATYHGDTAASPALRLYEALARILGNATQGVAAVSAPLAERLRRWVRTVPVHHVPNGIRLPAPCTPGEREAARAALGLAAKVPVISMVGRLSPEKGHVHLLDAIERMHVRLTVLAAGEGELGQALRQRACRADVRWLGFVREPRQVFAAADAVVIPSLTEGLPLVALEAMALGVPLLASSVGELPALLEGGAGRLVPPGDPGALAAALEEVLASADLRERMASLALDRVRASYGVEKMAAHYARALYEPAVAGSSRSRERAAIPPG
jgi:glycosyltransferase involved in cell wall biosynthesis